MKIHPLVKKLRVRGRYISLLFVRLAKTWGVEGRYASELELDLDRTFSNCVPQEAVAVMSCPTSAAPSDTGFRITLQQV
jgi:hypothetical protein